MATKGTSASVLVDEFIFDSLTSGVEMSVSVSELDITNLASTAMEYTAGLGTWELTQNGYFDGVDADGMADELHDRFGTSGAMVSYVLDKSSTGTPVLTIPSAINKNLPIEAATDSIITINGTWAATNAGHRGMLVCYNEEIDSTGGGTSIDLGSAGSEGGFAYLHVHTIDDDDSGTSTNTDIDIESSANDSSFDSEGTFTFSATGGNAVTMSGTVNRYIRYNCTDLGGATSLEVTLIVVVDGVTE